MKANRLSLLVIPCLCSILRFQNRVASEAPAEESALEKLFQGAASAEGAVYARLRAEILGQEGSIAFLEEKSQSGDLHSRVLAKAMLSWATEPEVNQRRRQLILEGVALAARSRPGILNSLHALAFGLRAARYKGRIEVENELHHHAAVPFLQELALKGLDPEDVGKQEKRANFGLWARCCAVGLLGGFKEPDVVPILTEILHSSDCYELRACAAAALYRSESLDAVEPLLKALSDPRRFVRASAYVSLTRITRQDFRRERKPVDWDGTDIGEEEQKEFQDWWDQNKEELLKKQRPRSNRTNAPIGVCSVLECGIEAQGRFLLNRFAVDSHDN